MDPRTFSKKIAGRALFVCGRVYPCAILCYDSYHSAVAAAPKAPAAGLGAGQPAGAGKKPAFYVRGGTGMEHRQAPRARRAVFALGLALLLAALWAAAGRGALNRPGPLAPASPSLPYRHAALFARMQAGDFSCVTQEQDRQNIEYCYRADLARDDVEWLLKDLNGDGLSEAVWLSRSYSTRIGAAEVVGIFAFVDGGVLCALFDTVDYTEVFFLSRDGRLIYTTFDGGIYTFESYYECLLDETFRMRVGEGLCIYRLDECSYTEMEPQAWMPEQPGVYYGRYDPASGQVSASQILCPWNTLPITRETFLEQFWRLTGYRYEDCADLSWGQTS